MIGTHYNTEEYNCAHYVCSWYKEKLNIEIPVLNVFELSFVSWLRKHFKPVRRPVNNDLVLMVNFDGSYHIGVYFNNGVNHNFKPTVGLGSVCWHSLNSIKSNYSNVRFFTWSK